MEGNTLHTLTSHLQDHISKGLQPVQQKSNKAQNKAQESNYLGEMKTGIPGESKDLKSSPNSYDCTEVGEFKTEEEQQLPQTDTHLRLRTRLENRQEGAREKRLET